MPGPAPQKHSRAAASRPGWLQLPAKGYDGEIPEWPLGDDVDIRALAVWDVMWRTPQAAAWIKLGWVRTVARYALLVVESERDLSGDMAVRGKDGEMIYRGPNATLLGEVRQMEDRLGLSPMAMRRLEWEVAEAPAEEGDQPAGVVSLDDRRAALG